MKRTLLYQPPEANQVLISVNPKAGARSGIPQINQLKNLLEDRGFRVEVLEDLNLIAEQANRLTAEGKLRVLVGAGGDGTAAELVNRTAPGVPIAMLPQGTENLLSKYLGQRRTPEALCETIVRGTLVQLDAGSALGAGMTQPRIFLLMAGCGFDAEVVRQVDANRTGHIRQWSYFKPILHAIRRYQYPEFRVYLQDEASEAVDSGASGRTIKARWAFIVNLPRYAWGLQFAPNAEGTDGLLDLCTFRHGSFWHGLRYLSFLLLGMHGRLKDCETARVGRLRIEADQKVPFQLDGDPGGVLPLEIQLLSNRLTLVVPEVWATSHGFNHEG